MASTHLIFLCLFGILSFFNGTLSACLFPQETPVVKYLSHIEISELQSGLEHVNCMYVIYLDARVEKWQRMYTLLSERGLHANRVSAVNGWQIPKTVQKELAGPYPMRLRGGQ